MSAYLESLDFPGMAHWMRMQYEEEVIHALKFFDFINDRDGRVFLKAIAEPPSEFGTVVEIFEEVLAHERKVTGLIHDLYALAVEENDYPTQSMLQWFIDEQVEEEKTASEMLAKVRLVQDYPPGLLMLDQEMSTRPAPTPPAEGEAA
jgi:ferritin